MDSISTGELERQLAELRSRVWHLEQTLTSRGILPQSQARVQAESPPPQPFTIPAPVAPAPHPPTPLPAGVGKNRASIETRIGSQWLNRIGILAVLIGMAWFLKLAIDNHWIGPLGRVLVGLIAGAGLIAWSERIRNQGYGGFSSSLKALGSGILYLALWAAFSLFHLIPAAVAFAAMFGVTAFNGFMSWLQNSELLALYAIVGGLSIPILLSTGQNQEVSLMSYLLLLDLAVLILVALRPWSRLLFSAFVGTVLLILGWWFSSYSSAQSSRTLFFIACFFLIFALAPRLVRATLHNQARIFGWETLAFVLLPLANAGLGFLAFYVLFDSSHNAWSGSWLAVSFAVFYLLLLRLPARGWLHPSPELLSSLHLTAAIVFLSIAIPLKTQGRWLTTGWLVEGAVLLWFARRSASMLLRVLALVCLLFGLSALILINPPAATTPFFNQRFAAYCIGIASFACVFQIARHAPPVSGEPTLVRWREIAAGAVLLVNALILLALGWEVRTYWSLPQWQANRRLLREYRIYAQFTYSALFMAFGAVLLSVGFWRRSAYLRWQGLILLAVAIAKVFLVDASELSEGYRILSFIGLGALLIAVSFIYQRDLLHLRKPEPPV